MIARSPGALPAAGASAAGRRWPVRRLRQGRAGPAEIAPGVFRLSVRGANVYFVRVLRARRGGGSGREHPHRTPVPGVAGRDGERGLGWLIC